MEPAGDVLDHDLVRGGEAFRVRELLAVVDDVNPEAGV
jgi:hypothetical protein